MGWVGIRGNTLVGYAQYERWDGSYVIDIALLCVHCGDDVMCFDVILSSDAVRYIDWRVL